MKHILLLAGASILAGSLSAQVVVTGKTTTVLGAFAQAGTTKSLKTVKANTAFTRYASARAYVRGASASSSGYVGSGYNWWTRQKYSYASTSLSGSIYGMSATSMGNANSTTDAKGGKPGAVTLAYMFKGKAATKGKLTVSLSGYASKGNTASVSVKIGTSTYKWDNTMKRFSKTLDVTIPAAGLAVSVTGNGAGALKGKGRSYYSARAYVSFTPAASSGGIGTCKVVKGTNSCGPILTGTVGKPVFGRHSVTLALSKAPISSFGLLLYSPDGKTVAMKNKCILFSKVVGFGLVRTDKTGAAKTTLRIPGKKDMKFWVQDAILKFGKTPELVTSNTLGIVCTKK